MRVRGITTRRRQDGPFADCASVFEVNASRWLYPVSFGFQHRGRDQELM
jgi:hypothetical protein